MNDNNKSFQDFQDYAFSDQFYADAAEEKSENEKQLKREEIIKENPELSFDQSDYDNAVKEQEENIKEYKKRKRKEAANRRKANGLNTLVKTVIIIIIAVIAFYLLNSVEVLTNVNRSVDDNIVNYQITVDNIMSFAWIRAKIEIPGVSDEYLDAHIELADNWKKYGDYYYYLGRVDPRSTIPVITSSSINLDDITTNELNLEVEAEAISYLLNKPNFGDENPWKDTKIHIMLK